MTELTQAEIYDSITYSAVRSVAPLEKSGTTTITYDWASSLPQSGISFTNWTSQFQTLTLAVMEEYERVLDIQFVPGAPDTTDRHVRLALASDFSTNIAGKGGFGYGTINGQLGDYEGWTATENNLNNYSEVFAHELGHALGLKHPFSGSPTLSSAYDHEGYSVMSYTSDPGPSDTNGYGGGWKVLQQDDLALFDVIALQELWGANLSQNTGNTSYDGATALPRTIVDGGGNDTLELGDWHTTKMNANIDLSRGGMSEIGRDTGGTPEFLRFGIDLQSDIENVVAPATPLVTVTGNDLANRIEATEVFGAGGFAAADHFEGLGGNDTLSGYTGNDTLMGGDGNDVIYGGSDQDELDGANDADQLFGQQGSDILAGGAGNDLLAGDAMDATAAYNELAAAGIFVA